MRYPGGKSRCFQNLINLIPPHRIYIETHLGGGAVLRHKVPADYTIGIDRDPNVIEVFRRRFPTYRFVTGRAEDFLRGFEFTGDEFVYADPPYMPSTRRSKRPLFRFDYTEIEHVKLLRLLRSIECRVLISGYANSTYDRELPGWAQQQFPGTSHVGRREETVWFNYSPKTLHDTRYLGLTFRDRQAIKRKRARWAERFRGVPIALQQALLSDFGKIFAEALGKGNEPK